MAEKQIDFSEILIVPLAQMIMKIGEGVAEAQRALDTSALERQNSLQNNYPALSEIGYNVTWYHMPEVQVELKMAVHYEKIEKDNTKGTGLFMTPFNAKYQKSLSYTAEGTSTIKLRIVPVPPPILSNVT